MCEPAVREFWDLPNEVLHLICKKLDTKALRALRLTCRRLSEISEMCIRLVFASYFPPYSFSWWSKVPQEARITSKCHTTGNFHIPFRMRYGTKIKKLTIEAYLDVIQILQLLHHFPQLEYLQVTVCWAYGTTFVETITANEGKAVKALHAFLRETNKDPNALKMANVQIGCFWRAGGAHCNEKVNKRLRLLAPMYCSLNTKLNGSLANFQNIKIQTINEIPEIRLKQLVHEIYHLDETMVFLEFLNIQTELDSLELFLPAKSILTDVLEKVTHLSNLKCLSLISENRRIRFTMDLARLQKLTKLRLIGLDDCSSEYHVTQDLVGVYPLMKTIVISGARGNKVRICLNCWKKMVKAFPNLRRIELFKLEFKLDTTQYIERNLRLVAFEKFDCTISEY